MGSVREERVEPTIGSSTALGERATSTTCSVSPVRSPEVAVWAWRSLGSALATKAENDSRALARPASRSATSRKQTTGSFAPTPPSRGRAAAIHLHTGADRAGETLGVQLLADIRAVWPDRGEKVFTRDLLEALNGLEEAPSTPGSATVNMRSCGSNPGPSPRTVEHEGAVANQPSMIAKRPRAVCAVIGCGSNPGQPRSRRRFRRVVY